VTFTISNRWFSPTLKSIPFIHRLPGLSSVMAAMFGEIMAVFGDVMAVLGDVMAVLWRCSAMLWRCYAGVPRCYGGVRRCSAMLWRCSAMLWRDLDDALKGRALPHPWEGPSAG